MKLMLAVAVAFFMTSCTHRIADNAAVRHRPSPGANAIERQVRNAVDAGDGDAVVRALRRQMAAEPENLSVRLQLAEHYKKAGYPDLALEHYRLAAERFPNDPKTVLLLAQALHDQSHTADAVKQLERFLALHQSASTDLYAWLGYLHDQLEDRVAAEAAHRTALSLNPSSARLHNNLGYNLLMQDKRSDAIDQFRRALALDPKMELAGNNLSMALMRGSSPNDRNEAYHQWLAMSGDKAVAHTNVAAALIERGLYAEARQELDAALRANRFFNPALKNLELVARLDGKPAALPQAAVAATSGSAPGSDSTDLEKSKFTKRLTRVWRAFAGIEDKPQKASGVTLATK